MRHEANDLQDAESHPPPDDVRDVHEAIVGFLDSQARFHSETSGPLLSQEGQKARRQVLQASLLSLVVTWGGMAPKNLSIFGAQLAAPSLAFLYAMLGGVTLFLYVTFLWRSRLEYTNSSIRRQLASHLARLEVVEIRAALRDTPSFPRELVEEFKEMTGGDDYKDGYRSAVMGTNPLTKFFEVNLAIYVAVFAILSCIFFAVLAAFHLTLGDVGAWLISRGV